MPCTAIDFGKAAIVMPPSRMDAALQVIAEDWRDRGLVTG